jgi:hypothetical protein
MRVMNTISAFGSTKNGFLVKISCLIILNVLVLVDNSDIYIYIYIYLVQDPAHCMLVSQCVFSLYDLNN